MAVFSRASGDSILASNARGSKRSGKSKSTPIAAGCSSAASPRQLALWTCASAEAVTLPESISSAADSPARTSATPESAPESVASAAACGANTHASFASYDRATSSWKTSQLCLDGEWSEFSETWPHAGTMRNGKAYEQAMLAPRTEENEFGLLPTPLSTDGEKDSPNRADSSGRYGLTGAALRWPTPHGFGTDGHGSELSVAVGVAEGISASERSAKKIRWPTPTVQDAKNDAGPSQFERNSFPLNAAVKIWPTPRSPKYGHDLAKYKREPSRKNPTDLETALVLTGEIGSLNPTWVEWLMGYPLGWTALEDSATPSSRKSRNGSPAKSSKRKKL